MLKRYQVLLSDWQEEYVKFLVEKYGMSFSEVIRVLVVLEAIMTTGHLYPEYKPSIPLKNLMNELKELSKPGRNEEEMNKLISDAHFEARKAIEYRMGREKKKK